MTTNDFIDFFKLFDRLTGYVQIAVPFILCLVGVGLIFLNRYNAFKLKHRKNIRVSAKITKSELSEHLSHGNNGTTMMYCPTIEYTYKINDNEYHSNCIAHLTCSFSTNNKQQIQSLVNQYPVEKVVTALVNSDDFNDAYLIEKSPGEWIVLAVGIFLIVASTIIYGLSR
jgi:hypothetical protein